MLNIPVDIKGMLLMEKLGFKNTIKSVLAAFIGVQSNKNRELDFNQGKLSHFIIAGVLIVVLFIFALITTVSLILPT